MSPPEEDWSIISSASDIDDESTASSREQEDSPTSAIDFILPEIHLDTSKEITNLDDTISLDPPEKSTNESKPQSRSTSTTGASVTLPESCPDSGADSGADSGDSGVDFKIRFYENLSHINQSIKQKSSDFYSNFARARLEQLNEYISQQEVPASVATSSPDVRAKDTSSALPLEPKDPTVLARTINSLHQFLDSHSDYLYYYCSGVVVSMLLLYYSVDYVSAAIYSTKPQPPTTVQPDVWSRVLKSYDSLVSLWDNYVYEDETVSNYYFFSKKKRINKLLRLGHKYASASVLGAHALTTKYIKAPAAYSASVIQQRAPVMWDTTQRLSQQSWHTFEEYAILGANRANSLGKVYGDLAWVQAKRYGVLGWNGLQSYTTSAWQFVTNEDTRQSVLGALKRTDDALIAFDRKCKDHVLRLYRDVAPQLEEAASVYLVAMVDGVKTGSKHISLMWNAFMDIKPPHEASCRAKTAASAFTTVGMF